VPNRFICKAFRGQATARGPGAHESSDADPAFDETFAFEIAVSLENCVRIDGQLPDHFLHRGQLIAGLQHPEPQSMLHLVNDLQVRRHPC